MWIEYESIERASIKEGTFSSSVSYDITDSNDSRCVRELVNRPAKIGYGEKLEYEIKGSFPVKAPSLASARKYQVQPEIYENWRFAPKPDMPFSEIRRKGLIKMTEYRIGTRRVSNFVVSSIYIDRSRPQSRTRILKKGTHDNPTQDYSVIPSFSGWRSYFWYNATEEGVIGQLFYSASTRPGNLCGYPGLVEYPKPRIIVPQNWDLVGVCETHFKYAYPNIPRVGNYLFTEPNIQSELNSVKLKAMVGVKDNFDLLTNVAEAKRSLQTITGLARSASRLLTAWRKGRSIKGKSFDQASESLSAWLEYRYGIMPIIYSVLDAVKVLKHLSAVYSTFRSTEQVDINLSFPDSYTLSTLKEGDVFDVARGAIRVTATGKVKYDNPAERLLSQVSINPIKTAWELTPYSLVVNWFCNVGDWLDVMSSQLFKLKTQDAYCYAVRKNYTVDSYIMVRRVERRDWETKPISDSLIPVLYRSETIDSYERQPYTVADVGLPNVDVNFSSWQRWLDAFALSKKPIFQSLRSLL